MRSADICRTTGETKISARIALDGEGNGEIDTGIGFFDHMLAALAKHALIDLTLTCSGDLHVDGHHTVEDCGIVLGDALAAALGDRAGIARFGHSYVPMDEALAFCAMDLSNRGFLRYEAEMTAPMIGAYDAQLTEEFFRGVAVRGGITLHMRCDGRNAHHMTEAMFKAFGRSLRIATAPDERVKGVLSTKGVLTT